MFAFLLLSLLPKSGAHDLRVGHPGTNQVFYSLRLSNRVLDYTIKCRSNKFSRLTNFMPGSRPPLHRSHYIECNQSDKIFQMLRTNYNTQDPRNNGRFALFSPARQIEAVGNIDTADV